MQHSDRCKQQYFVLRDNPKISGSSATSINLRVGTYTLNASPDTTNPFDASDQFGDVKIEFIGHLDTTSQDGSGEFRADLVFRALPTANGTTVPLYEATMTVSGYSKDLAFYVVPRAGDLDDTGARLLAYHWDLYLTAPIAAAGSIVQVTGPNFAISGAELSSKASDIPNAKPVPKNLLRLPVYASSSFISPTGNPPPGSILTIDQNIQLVTGSTGYNFGLWPGNNKFAVTAFNNSFQFYQTTSQAGQGLTGTVYTAPGRVLNLTYLDGGLVAFSGNGTTN